VIYVPYMAFGVAVQGPVIAVVVHRKPFNASNIVRLISSLLHACWSKGMIDVMARRFDSSAAAPITLQEPLIEAGPARVGLA
jgi:hypothetical protein